MTQLSRDSTFSASKIEDNRHIDVGRLQDRTRSPTEQKDNLPTVAPTPLPVQIKSLVAQEITESTSSSIPVPNSNISKTEAISRCSIPNGSLRGTESKAEIVKHSLTPEYEPANEQKKPRSCWKSFNAWRSRREVALWSCFATIFLVFLTNAILTIVAQVHLSQLGPDSYLRTVYVGKCNKVHRISVILHLIINILSTLMLGASNLCLQLIASPSREQINIAHSRGISLEIGIPSIRNLRHIPVRSRIVWCILGLSSLAIHFVYNSVILSSVTANYYALAVVRPAFFAQPFSNDTITGTPGAPIDPGSFAYRQSYGNPEFYPVVSTMTTDYDLNRDQFQNLSTPDCLLFYDNVWGVRPNLFLVTSGTFSSILGDLHAENASLMGWRASEAQDLSLCQESESEIHGGCANLTQWTQNDARAWGYGFLLDPSLWPIEYCIVNTEIVTESQKEQQLCYLQCSPTLLLVVTIFNGLKLFCILWIIFAHKEPTLCTLGDAIASFLEIPDEATKSFGVATTHSFAGPPRSVLSKKGGVLVWRPIRVRWWKASTPSRWILITIAGLIVLFLGCYSAGDGIYVNEYYGDYHNFRGLLQSGFGFTSNRGKISWNQKAAGQSGLFENIILTNSWQVLLSILYVAANAVLNALLVADEWAGFAKDRKYLRVSYPKAEQRSTYFLSMPLRYSIPIMIAFVLMHWLLSESAFAIRVVDFDWSGKHLPGWTTAGYSVIPALLSIILGAAMMIAYGLNAWLRKYPANPGMPLVSTCSLAISANCHRPAGDDEAYLRPVMWGVYEDDDGFGRSKCSFTSLEVSPPAFGQTLFGLREEEQIVSGKQFWGFYRKCCKFLAVFW